MVKQTLIGNWQFRQAGARTWLPASVPGTVHTDLMAAGRIPDPFVGENELQVKWVADQNWEYRREFDAGAGLLAEDRVYLVCEGLDTLAEVSLNGQLLGRTDNMFRQHRWEVKKLLQAPGKNTLLVVFSSPLAYIKARQAARPLPTIMNGGMAHLRKVQSHFGLDLEQARQNPRVRSLADVKPAGTALSDRIQRLLIGLKPANLAGQLFSRLM